MKRITLILFLTSLWNLGYSQDTKIGSYKPQYIIYLKNGNIVSGALLEYVEGDHITIETENQKEVTYNQEVISKITKSEKLIASKQIENKTKQTSNEYFSTSPFGVSKLNTAHTTRSVQLDFGYNIGALGLYRFNLIGQLFNNDIQRAGIGIGYRRYASDNKDYFPVFASLKSKLGSYKNGIFLGLDLGCSLDDNLVPMGIYAHPNIGVGFQIARLNYLQFMIGYDIQKGLDTWYLNNTSPISFSAGLTF